MDVEVNLRKETHISAEEKLKSKDLYKAMLGSVRIIPILISGIYVLNTILSYFGIDWEGFSYIVQFLFIGFTYISSLTLRFCKYHRVFIHYITLTLILNIIDYHWGLPFSDRNLFLMYMVLAGFALFVALYLHQKEVQSRKEKLK